MNHRLTSTLVLASVSLAACGGGSDGAANTASQPAPGAATTPAPATAPTAASGGSGAAPSAGSASSRKPCAVVTSKDVSAAFGTAAHAGRPKGDSGCTYRAGSHSLAITVRTVPAKLVARLRRAQPTQGRSGTTVYSGDGYFGSARSLVAASQGAGGAVRRGTGAQASAGVVKGTTSVVLILSDSAKRSGSLVDAAARLGRAAGERL